MAATITPAYRIRPLGLGDVLDEAFRIYRARFPLMFGAALVASIPGIVFGIGGGGNTLMLMYLQGALGATSGVDRSILDPSLSWLLVVGVVLGVVIYPITASVPYFAASAAALGLPATTWSITWYSLRNFFKLLVLSVVTAVMAALWFLGVTLYFLVRWSFVFQADFLEHAGVGGSFRRSSALVTDGWWRIFGIRLLTKVIIVVIGWVIGLLFALPALLLPAGLIRQSTSGILLALVGTVTLPYPALVCTLLYLDQRVRREALDLQLMAGQVGAPPAGAAPEWQQAPPPPSWAGSPSPSSDLPPPSPGLPPPSR